MTFINQLGLFLIKIIFDLYLFIILFRVILHWAGVDPRTQLAHFVIKLTEPVLKPVRGLIPMYRRIDISAVLLVWVLHTIKFLLVVLLQTGAFPNIIGLSLLALGNTLNQIIDLFFYAVIVRIILSWVTAMPRGPMVELVNTMTEPLLSPARRWIPLIGGVDFSPIVVLIVIKVISIGITFPLLSLGGRMVAMSLTGPL